MRVLHAVVLSQPLLMLRAQAEVSESGGVGPQFIRHHDGRREPLLLEKRSHEFPSGRSIAAPCSDDELYVALTAPVTDAAGCRLPIDKASWIRAFPTLALLIARLEGVARWDRFEVVHLPRWSQGRVAILGDAAHAMAPNLGQGGACAMMNALALPQYVGDAADIPSALATWERRERPPTDHTQRLSSLYSQLTFWPGFARSTVFWLFAKIPQLRRQQWRCARHAPTGWSPGAAEDGSLA